METSVYREKKEYKRKLFREKRLACLFCPYHKVENGKRKPKSDRHKNHRDNLITGRDYYGDLL